MGIGSCHVIVTKIVMAIKLQSLMKSAMSQIFYLSQPCCNLATKYFFCMDCLFCHKICSFYPTLWWWNSINKIARKIFTRWVSIEMYEYYNIVHTEIHRFAFASFRLSLERATYVLFPQFVYHCNLLYVIGENKNNKLYDKQISLKTASSSKSIGILVCIASILG